jgi:hypothetical protein
MIDLHELAQRLPTEVAFGVGLVGVSAAAWAYAARSLERLRFRWRLAARMDVARRGDARAYALLEEAGYRVVGSQVSTRYVVVVGEPPAAREHEVLLRADYVVERGGEVFVAEVKTGASAPRIETSATRRQLLEYRIAFDVDGVLLVDADRRAISAVRFPRAERSAPVRAAGAHHGPTHQAFTVLALLVVATLAWIAFRAMNAN